MRVLFVSSGNRIGISPIIRNQANSLIEKGIEIDFYTIQGKGLKGYLKNIKPLRKYIRNGKYDVIHAHYSLSAFVASIAGAKPLIVSLMGSDVKAKGCYKLYIRLFSLFYKWKSIIVKSNDMQDSLAIKHVKVIPNGVDLYRFCSLNQKDCQRHLDWDETKKHVLFPANPERKEKNYALAKMAVDSLADENIEIHTLKNIPNEEMPFWYNAADVVLMTSFWEGSPNAIKEAMACGCPIISVGVGDVKDVVEGIDGCYITSYTTEEVAEKLKKAFEFSQKTNGRQRIEKLGLDSKTIAQRILNIYENASYKK